MLAEASLAGLLGASSNPILTQLEEWNNVLRFSSLGKGKLVSANDGEDGSAPREAVPAVARRRHRR